LPITSPTVKIQQTKMNAVRLFLYAEKLIYLVQTASVQTNTLIVSICSRIELDGAILELL
jgi:hypothetical protein